MPSQATIDLSTLPAPAVIQQISFEDIFAAMLADLQARDPAFTALVESDPAYAILEVAAYREVLIRQQCNEAAVQNMLAYATETNLTNLGANFNVPRAGTPAAVTIGAGASAVTFTADAGGVAGDDIQVAFLAPTGPSTALSVAVTGQLVQVTLGADATTTVNSTAAAVMAAVNANPAAALLLAASLPGAGTGLVAVTPPTNLAGGVDELDSAYRARVQLSLVGFSCAGPKGAYEFFALSVPGVGDISVQGPEDDETIPAGTVMVCVLGTVGTGALADPNPATAGESGEDPLLGLVRAALSADNVRPLTDTVVVRAATAVNYAITASLTTYPGPDPNTVVAASLAAATAYAAAQHKIGKSVTLAGIIAALFTPGVQNVAITSPTADVAITDYQFSNCTAVTVTYGGTAT